jgi:hypothetical protein
MLVCFMKMNENHIWSFIKSDYNCFSKQIHVSIIMKHLFFQSIFLWFLSFIKHSSFYYLHSCFDFTLRIIGMKLASKNSHLCMFIYLFLVSFMENLKHILWISLLSNECSHILNFLIIYHRWFDLFHQFISEDLL